MKTAGPTDGISADTSECLRKDAAQSQQAFGTSIFTALEEQLGLKLEARKQPVDAIMIDHIEQPSPN